MATPKVDKKLLTIFEHYAGGMNPVASMMVGDSNFKRGKTELVDPMQIVGLELEIESFTHGDRQPHFQYTEDGSLRNHGREAITIPIKTFAIEDMLKKFYTHHRITGENFSERCSTHVHVNVQDMTFDQVKVLALTYQIVERLLFAFVGNDRQDNIFCVPWYQSGVTPSMVEKMARDPDYIVRNWVKYNALNLLPIRSQGTVEYRHLHGTCDVATILDWVNLITSLNVFAKRNTFDDVSKLVLDMNTVSNYDQFLADVFGGYRDRLTHINDYRGHLSWGVVDAKMMLLKPKKAEKKMGEYDAAYGSLFVENAPAQPPQRMPWDNDGPARQTDAQLDRVMRSYGRATLRMLVDSGDVRTADFARNEIARRDAAENGLPFPPAAPTVAVRPAPEVRPVPVAPRNTNRTARPAAVRPARVAATGPNPTLDAAAQFRASLERSRSAIGTLWPTDPDDAAEPLNLDSEF